VYTGLHFPFDILGSLAVAVFSACALAIIRKPLLPLYDTIIQIVNRLEVLITRKNRGLK